MPTPARATTKAKTQGKPLNDDILDRPAEAEEKTRGGIILPDTAKEKPAEGVVMAMGDGRLLDDGKRAAFTVKVGDRVIYSKYAGHEITIDGDELKVVQESDIYAVIDA